jgi:CRISPR system Cascade subunit CasA
MTTFNLTREPWIPVESINGRVFDVSTRDALRRAHELRALADPSPLVVGALTRHLLAVLHRSYDGPRSMKEWVAIARAGAFDAARVETYLDRVEDRLDLFHPTRPFAQTRGLVARFGEYVTPIDELEVLRSRWGTGRELFRHSPEQHPRMTPARAARALLAHQAFATGGLVKKPGEPTSATAAPLARAALVVVRSETLFQTLTANLLRYGADGPVPTGGAADACSWEQDPPPRELHRTDEPKRVPRGYLDLLTWLSRRVEFVHDGATVTGFVNAVGQGLDANGPHDPMVAYRRHEKHGWLPIGIDVERAFWRDSAALFEATRNDTSQFERPRAIDLVANPDAIEIIGNVVYDIEVMGMAAEKSRVDAVRVERIQAHGRSFNDPDAGTAVRDALDFAQRTVDALNAAIFIYARAALSPGERQSDTATVRALVDSLGGKPAAWSALGLVFEHFLRRLGEDPRAALAAFRLQTGSVINDVYRGVTARSETTGRWLKARALADRSFAERVAGLERPSAAPSNEGSATA